MSLFDEMTFAEVSARHIRYLGELAIHGARITDLHAIVMDGSQSILFDDELLGDPREFGINECARHKAAASARNQMSLRDVVRCDLNLLTREERTCFRKGRPFWKPMPSCAGGLYHAGFGIAIGVAGAGPDRDELIAASLLREYFVAMTKNPVFA